MEENKMGVMPVNKLLITMSLPMIASMFVQALYNIVDSVFVSMISEDALTAVSLAFPIQNLMIAIASGTGIGINALLSRNLGKKNMEGVNKSATTGIVLTLFSYSLFLIFGIFMVPLFFQIQSDSNVINQLGYEYLSICAIFSFGIFFEITFERLLQATGRTMFSMASQTTGAITNMILDPIFIFGFGFIPAMGIRGAAIATVIGQIVAAMMACYFNVKKNHEVTIDFKKYKPNMDYVKKIYAIGFPSIIMVSIGSLMTFGMNQILMGFTKSAAAFFGGVYIKLQSLIFMPIFGMNNGLIPIVSYNYGAKNKERITKAVKYACIYATIIMSIGFIVFQLFPAQLLSLFQPSEEMLKIGIYGLRIISFHFLLAGISIILSTSCQALGHGVLSLIGSVARQLVVLLPVAYAFSLTGNINYVWLSYPISEVVSLALMIFFFKKVYDNQIKVLP